ncbi:Transcriptional regulator, AraC family [Mucinivorans hirudinis]|uniref:Transcriptional regulator, AraC family n=1 Tax=Mucinivorans hirudinis TaxID=1433126 RepID=A0A060R7E2_9BACT|nr:Transcriptional regulator, AraC family [Mucinivorans hirudinis]
MLRYRQYTPFSVLEWEADVWDFPVHKHNYYEIVIIRNGEGTHTINEQTFPYKQGDIFLLSPEDHHCFGILKKSSFCFIKFTELVFKKNKTDDEQRQWLERIETIIAVPNQTPGAIRFRGNDKEHILRLTSIILEEHKEQGSHSPEIVADGMSMLVSIIARNINYNYQPKNKFRTDLENSRISSILTYIRHNVYTPEKISVDAIAENFDMSKNYVGIFFKKHTGETLQNYLLNYRLFLVENRILTSNSTISSIAADLGFTDSSHLNKHFKRRFGMMPGEYRKIKHRGTTPSITPMMGNANT